MAEDHDRLAWRNLVVQWHTGEGMPDCGCDDETPDHRLCPPSVAWADARFSERDDLALAGPEDVWNHDVWKAAWGRNVTLIASDTDYRLPRPPEGTSWLARRLLVGGRPTVELLLYRMTANRLAVAASGRVQPDPQLVVAKANQVMKRAML